MIKRVLIVDDSRLARMAVIKGLSKLRPGWTYSEASNPDEAIAAMNASPADLAIIDFNMPIRDGLTLAGELLELAPTLPIALLSANAQQEILDRTAQLGAIFLTKPLNETAFSAFLDSASGQVR
ncbi:MAG: response regulator [Burkholderiales bacterium]|nr:MAG: response regulator [Burkholderiales bacterium]